MLAPLSDRTKSFVAVSAVLAVALCNVIFGMDWVRGPSARRVPAVAGVTEAPIVAPPPAVGNSLPTNGNAAPPANVAPRPNAAQMNEPVSPPPEAAQPRCDVTACIEAYRSFRESDCTYQPNIGPRRLCTKGRPPQ